MSHSFPRYYYFDWLYIFISHVQHVNNSSNRSGSDPNKKHIYSKDKQHNTYMWYILKYLVLPYLHEESIAHSVIVIKYRSAITYSGGVLPFLLPVWPDPGWCPKIRFQKKWENTLTRFEWTFFFAKKTNTHTHTWTLSCLPFGWRWACSACTACSSTLITCPFPYIACASSKLMTYNMRCVFGWQVRGAVLIFDGALSTSQDMCFELNLRHVSSYKSLRPLSTISSHYQHTHSSICIYVVLPPPRQFEVFARRTINKHYYCCCRISKYVTCVGVLRLLYMMCVVVMTCCLS